MSSESPTSRLTHLQVAGRQSPNVNDFALVGLRIFEATGADVTDLGAAHAAAHVTTMLDAGVDLRDVQIAARHADPRTTMRYDRARKNLDRHPNYVLAAFMAART